MLDTNFYFKNQRILSWTFGAFLAAFLYWLLASQVKMDCQTAHLSLYNNGIGGLFGVLMLSTLLLLLGVPLPMIAFCCGILTSPVAGSAISGIALIIGSSVSFLIGRLLQKLQKLRHAMEVQIDKSQFIRELLESRSSDPFQWYKTQSQRVACPYPWFSFLVAANSAKISIFAMIAATFYASLFASVLYSIAGAFVGCAILDQIQGLEIKKYLIPSVLSSLLIFYFEYLIRRRNNTP